jgi:regulator of protease activity HflC (stomatin/prohibitin superfamily)
LKNKLAFLIPLLLLVLPSTALAYNGDGDGWGLGAYIAIGAAGLFILIFAIAGFKVIKQAEVMVIERFGEYKRTLKSGLHLIVPIVDKPRKVVWRMHKSVRGRTYVQRITTERIDLREQVYDFPAQAVITKDNVRMQVNALLYFQITDPIKALYEIQDLPQAIEKLTQTTMRNVMGELDLDETLISRDLINNKLRIVLDEATDKWGVKVNRVELQDITPPPEIEAAMQKQSTAERERRATILEAEGEKKSAILRAEGDRESRIARAEGMKQEAILEAEGYRQRQRLEAQGDADALRLRAEGEYDAITKVKDAVGPQVAPNYLIAVKYLTTLNAVSQGEANKIFFPFELTNVLGSVGTLTEMFRGGGAG